MSFVKELNSKFRIILASASPRRKELLELVGIDFEIWPSDKDEDSAFSTPGEICTDLSGKKALDVAAQIKTYNENHSELTTPTDILVIGADTIVVKSDRILGKPKDEEDARNMLKLLSGDVHSVFTGVTFVFMSGEGRTGEYTFFEETKVNFYPLDDDEIDEYIASGDAMDKAGAYGIQTGAAAFVRSITGDYFNVVGLPVARLIRELKALM